MQGNQKHRFSPKGCYIVTHAGWQLGPYSWKTPNWTMQCAETCKTFQRDFLVLQSSAQWPEYASPSQQEQDISTPEPAAEDKGWLQRGYKGLAGLYALLGK